jgi:response regulator RpfG family c-di-GMP phosphodiesterase
LSWTVTPRHIRPRGPAWAYGLPQAKARPKELSHPVAPRDPRRQLLLLTFVKYWREEQTVKSRNKDLVAMQNFTIQCLAALTETRDSETGRHIERCQHYVKLLSEQLAKNPKYSEILDEETIDLLYRSASLHDIGKVGIPDSILLKPAT